MSKASKPKTSKTSKTSNTSTALDHYSEIIADPIFTPALVEQIADVQAYQTRTEKFVTKVLRGTHKNAILQGPPGLGKSYVVQQALIAQGLVEGDDYQIIKGHLRPMELFKLLYLYRRKGQIVVLDDCDDIFTEEMGLSFIKAATDPDNRRINYESSRVPLINGTPVKDFVYNGTLIICSNITMSSGRGRRSQHMAAIYSRTTNWPMGWHTKERKFAQVFNMVVNHDYLNTKNDPRIAITTEQKLDLLRYLLENLDEINTLDLRLPQKIAAEINADPADWQANCMPFLKV
jgi:hypothetical protein